MCGNVLESKQPIDEVKSYGRLGPESVMFNYSGCAGIIIVEADRLGVGHIRFVLETDRKWLIRFRPKTKMRRK